MPLPSSSVRPRFTNCSQASSTWPISAMSAMEQPALRSGRTTDLSGTRQDVGALRHEMHAAEDDVAAFGLRRHLRKAVGIAAIIGKTHDFIALIVMSEDDALAAQVCSGGRNAGVHRVVGEYEIVFERAGCCFCNRCCSHFYVSAFSPGRVTSVVIGSARPGTGMLKADSRLQ